MSETRYLTHWSGFNILLLLLIVKQTLDVGASYVFHSSLCCTIDQLSKITLLDSAWSNVRSNLWWDNCWNLQWNQPVFCFCSVDSSDINWKRKKSGGVKIVCQSETRDFSAMAFITDHVNSLMEQWFPGQSSCVWSHCALDFQLLIFVVVCSGQRENKSSSSGRRKETNAKTEIVLFDIRESLSFTSHKSECDSQTCVSCSSYELFSYFKITRW